MPFSGNIKVEGDEFKARFSRFIYRNDGIAFDLEGRDEYGKFHSSGTFHQDLNGRYISMIELVYPHYAKDLCTSDALLILNSHVLKRNGRLNIEAFEFNGEWHENGDAWMISGKLK